MNGDQDNQGMPPNHETERVSSDLSTEVAEVASSPEPASPPKPRVLASAERGTDLMAEIRDSFKPKP